MSVYRLPRNRKNDYRTPSYRFTVASKDDPSLVALKEGIALRNAQVRKNARAFGKFSDYDKLYTVRLMARGPRRWHTKYKSSLVRYFKGQHMVPQNQKLLHFNADSNLNHKFAVEFDVYVHRSREMEDVLRTEIETGLSTGDQNKIRKLQSEIWHLEFKAKNKVKHA